MKETIHKILLENPLTRDNAIHLASVYYDKTIPSYGILKANKMLRMMYRKEIPTMDSISRCSRLLQNKHHELRGNNWIKRQAHSEKVREAAINDNLFEN